MIDTTRRPAVTTRRDKDKMTGSLPSDGMVVRTFNDSPGVPAYPNFVECYDSFVIYHVFRPDRQCTTENIYVTLGVDSWAWAGRAMYYSDQWDLLESESYVLQPNGPGNEDEFPVWEDIHGGN